MCALYLRITYTDIKCCPGPYVAATRARRSPRCISPAVDSALPSRRKEIDSSIPSSVILLHCPVRCKIEYTSDLREWFTISRETSSKDITLHRYVVLMIAKWCVIPAYGLTHISYLFHSRNLYLLFISNEKRRILRWNPKWETRRKIIFYC